MGSLLKVCSVVNKRSLALVSLFHIHPMIEFQ